MKRATIVVAVAVALVFASSLGISRALDAKREWTGAQEELRDIRAEIMRIKEKQMARASRRSLGEPTAFANSALVKDEASAQTPSPSKDEDKPERGDDEGKTEDERQHELTVLNEARADLCQSTHADEAPDPEWADSAASTVRSAFSESGLDPAGLAVDCRTTLCRVDFTYPADKPMAAGRLNAANPWPGRRFWKTDLERRAGFIYFAREGYELPYVDETALKY